jgi:hypothetical protein
MEWHFSDIASIFHHLPHSLGDLLNHEDKSLVSAGAPGLVIKPSGEGGGHRLILPDSASGDSGVIPGSGIEKDMEPSRAQQDFSLIIRDYLRGLPGFSAQNRQGEALLAHWRRILLEQPRRLAEAQLETWNDERFREFWKERLSHYSTDFGIGDGKGLFPADDWERAAGTLVPSIDRLGGIKSKQWQDLVIRQRLHNLDIKNQGMAR